MKLIYESYYQNLGQNIAFYRNRRKLTQLKLSELVEISRNHLSRIENADCAVSLDTVLRRTARKSARSGPPGGSAR